MQRDQGAEITFTVRPRPAVADIVRPLQAGPLAPRPDRAPDGTAPEDVTRHADTPIGDIAFLARFAFGGY